MRKSIKAGVLALAASAAVAVPLAGAASASAATVPGVVHAVVHSAGHLDTTNVSGPATIASPGGPVWAYDNLTEKFSAVPTGAGTWAVTIDVNGSFAGFADPATGQALTSNGPVKGTIEYNVSSPVAPDAKALPAQEADGTGLGVALGQLFGQADGASIFAAHTGADQVTSGGDYTFSYQNGSYVQDTSGITGDVTGH